MTYEQISAMRLGPLIVPDRGGCAYRVFNQPLGVEANIVEAPTGWTYRLDGHQSTNEFDTPEQALTGLKGLLAEDC